MVGVEEGAGGGDGEEDESRHSKRQINTSQLLKQLLLSLCEVFFLAGHDDTVEGYFGELVEGSGGDEGYVAGVDAVFYEVEGGFLEG